MIYEVPALEDIDVGDFVSVVSDVGVKVYGFEWGLATDFQADGIAIEDIKKGESGKVMSYPPYEFDYIAAEEFENINALSEDRRRTVLLFSHDKIRQLARTLCRKP